MGTEEYSANLRRSIRQLQEKARIKNTLKPLPKRGSITAKAQRAKRSGAGGTAIKSPLTEAAATRTFHPVTRELVSSDGLLVLEYRNVATITMADANKAQVKFVYDDYVPA